jgi:hypothetical protein
MRQSFDAAVVVETVDEGRESEVGDELPLDELTDGEVTATVDAGKFPLIDSGDVVVVDLVRCSHPVIAPEKITRKTIKEPSRRREIRITRT